MGISWRRVILCAVLAPGSAGALAQVNAETTVPAVQTQPERLEQPAEHSAETKLVRLVESYFQAEAGEERATLATAIEEAADSDWAAVARALERVQLWSHPKERAGTFEVNDGRGGIFSVAYEVPENYDPTKRHGAILCVSNGTDSRRTAISTAQRILGKAAEEMIFLCPDRRIAGWFHEDPAGAEALPRLLRSARERFHLDNDHVLLIGLPGGGDAWSAAINHADLFSGAILLASYPDVPYSRQVVPILLENLQALPVLTAWWSADEAPAASPLRLVTDFNRAIVGLARDRSWPIEGVEVPVGSASQLTPPADKIAILLARRRVQPRKNLAHWFRYPGQGHAGWLRQTKFLGEVWTAEQLSILPAPQAAPDAFIGGVVRDKLARLAAVVDGQTITLETHRCGRIALLLPEGLIEPSKPITVLCNGRRRFSRAIQPSVRTLLGHAYRNWAFQHPILAELSFSIRSEGPGG